MDRVVIIGGGISGLALAYALRGMCDADISVFESEEKPGGKIWTTRQDGYLTEGGVNGFLDNRPKSLELASSLAIEPLRSSDAARKRFIYLKGRRRLLPESPPAFLKSDVLSLPGKLRVAMETIVPRGGSADESLAEFARRRLGGEAFENLIDPMASGIYAGDPEKMSLQSCFPKIHNLEMKYGGLIRGMLKLSSEAKKSGAKKAVGAGPGGTLTSFSGGMGDVIAALRASLGGALRVSSRAMAVEKISGRYVTHLSDGSKVESDVVVIATPAYETARMLKDFDRMLSSYIEDIPYPAVSVVCLGYRKDKVPGPHDCFGFLVPNREKRKILGTLYDSSIYPGRAPEGYILLRTMVGGARASELAMEDEGTLLKTVMKELSDIIGIKADPDFSRVFRHERAIPQYLLGHVDRLAKIDEALSGHHGMYITGNAYKGIGFNDCVENSFRLAERITKEVL